MRTGWRATGRSLGSGGVLTRFSGGLAPRGTSRNDSGRVRTGAGNSRERRESRAVRRGPRRAEARRLGGRGDCRPRLARVHVAGDEDVRGDRRSRGPDSPRAVCRGRAEHGYGSADRTLPRCRERRAAAAWVDASLRASTRSAVRARPGRQHRAEVHLLERTTEDRAGGRAGVRAELPRCPATSVRRPGPRLSGVDLRADRRIDQASVHAPTPLGLRERCDGRDSEGTTRYRSATDRTAEAEARQRERVGERRLARRCSRIGDAPHASGFAEDRARRDPGAGARRPTRVRIAAALESMDLGAGRLREVETRRGGPVGGFGTAPIATVNRVSANAAVGRRAKSKRRTR